MQADPDEPLPFFRPHRPKPALGALPYRADPLNLYAIGDEARPDAVANPRISHVSALSRHFRPSEAARNASKPLATLDVTDQATLGKQYLISILSASHLALAV